MRSGLYLTLLLLAAAPACKKKNLTDDPDEKGKLSRIATRLDEAYGEKPLPKMEEPVSFAERLNKWDDFRSCTVRAYIARKGERDRALQEGIPRAVRHGTIGEAAVEECAVESAVVNKDPSLCERLALDFQGPNGEVPTSAIRCWDTRARVLGLPDECPVVWTGDDAPERNPECLAMARRDASFCSFAGDPLRCRALVSGDKAACTGAAPDCEIALAYWDGLIPASLGPPALELRTKPGEEPPGASIDLSWPGGEEPTIRIKGPQSASGISWPTGRKPAGPPPSEMTQFWGGTVAAEAAQVTWRDGQVAVKIAFLPAGQSGGPRPVQPPGPLAPATVMLVWPDPRAFRRCLPSEETKGELRYSADLKPGGIVNAQLKADNLICTDGRRLNVAATLKLVVLDLR